eukprot:GEMP01095963.1.p1 GENE.GEMP01095963.1~~GEMP01095963.1.p1  ORF type:complete len:250 (+),score=50.76 GEMP01095963.1:33-782(+)
MSDDKAPEIDFQPLKVGGSKLSLLKVPAWLSQRWMQQKEGALAGFMDENSFTLADDASSTPSESVPSVATRFDIVRRPVETLYCFRREEDLHVVELVSENVTIRPSLADSNYRAFLHQRNSDSSAATKKHRTEHHVSGRQRQLANGSTQMMRIPLASDRTAHRQRVTSLAAASSVRPQKRSREALFETVRDFLESKSTGQSYTAILAHTGAGQCDLNECIAVGCDLRPIKEGSSKQGYFIKERYKRRKS